MTRAVMIVNPASANGRTARQWPEIARKAVEHGLDVDVVTTEARDHATQLAREAADAGAELVVAVGGDGTVSEVVNGLMAAAGPRPDLAVVCRGSGCDLIRSFGIPKDSDRALAIAAGGHTATLDVGVVEYTGHDGRPASRHFANIASAGMTGIAADRVNRSGKPLGATVAFAWAAIATFVGYRNSRFRVEIDGRPIDQVCNNVIVANCRYFAGGMKIAPLADPADGQLEVIVQRQKPPVRLTEMRLVYSGKHLSHPSIRAMRCRSLSVRPADGRTVLIEADGELSGQLPATFGVAPDALTLLW